MEVTVLSPHITHTTIRRGRKKKKLFVFTGRNILSWSNLNCIGTSACDTLSASEYIYPCAGSWSSEWRKYGTQASSAFKWTKSCAQRSTSEPISFWLGEQRQDWHRN